MFRSYSSFHIPFVFHPAHRNPIDIIVNSLVAWSLRSSCQALFIFHILSYSSVHIPANILFRSYSSCWINDRRTRLTGRAAPCFMFNKSSILNPKPLQRSKEESGMRPILDEMYAVHAKTSNLSTYRGNSPGWFSKPETLLSKSETLAQETCLIQTQLLTHSPRPGKKLGLHSGRNG